MLNIYGEGVCYDTEQMNKRFSFYKINICVRKTLEK